MDLSPSPHILLNNIYINFISSSHYSSDFELLSSFLQSSDQNFQYFFSRFFNHEKQRKSLPTKSIPLPPSNSKSQTRPLRKSAELKLSFNFTYGNSIPAFYSKVSDIHVDKLKSYKPSDYILTLHKFQKLLKTKLSLPSFFALPIMMRLDPTIKKTKKFEIQFSKFIEFAYDNLNEKPLNEAIFAILDQTNKGYLLPGDFAPFIVSLIQTHPSLKFLQHEIQLQSAYCKCIISRIFYTIDTDLRGQISFSKFAKSNFCDSLIAVDNAVDVSDVSDYFSYEHFYVLYSLFSIIDLNETGRISVEQMAEYDDFRVPLRLVKRFVSFIPFHNEELISFSDFVYFICAVEDKSSETALHLWFRVCDEDEAGVISPYQIKHLYSMQKDKMASVGIDPIQFKYVQTKIVDLIGSSSATLLSLQKSRCWDSFFNIIVDYQKYAEQESRDPMFKMRIHQQSLDGPVKQWDIFCQEEYKRLSSD